MHILDHQTDKILCVLENKISSPSFWDDEHMEDIKNVETFDFMMRADVPESVHASKRNRVIIPDDDGHLREFIIFKTNQFSDMTKQIYTVASYTEIKKQKKPILPTVLEGQTVNMAMDWTLAGTEWKRGITEYAGIRKVTIDVHKDAYQVLKQLTSLYGLEMRFRVEHDGNRIIGRYVDMVKKRGEETKKEIELGKDLIGVERKESSDIVTALLVLGPEQEDGSRLTVDVFDQDALQRWGREGKHLWAMYEPQTENEDITLDRLKQLGEQQLAKMVNTYVEYDATAAALENIFGLSHEKVRLGDVNRLKDTSYKPPLYLEARIIEISRSISDKSKRSYKLGDFIEYSEEDIKRTFKQLLILYGQKVIRRDTPPSNPRQGMVWVDTSGELDVIYTWNHYGQRWEKATPTFAEEVGAYDKETVDNKDKSVFDDATWYTDVVSEEKKQEAIQHTNTEVQKRELSILRQETEPSGTNYALDQLWLRTTDDVYFKWTGSEWKQITPSLAALGEKAGLEYVNGQLVTKANKGETYTISEVDNALDSKVSLISYTSDQDGIVQRFMSAESRISQTEEAITSKVSQISFDEVEGRVSSAESTLIQHATLIESKVNQSTYETDRNGIISRLNNAESSISQQANEITQRVRTEEYLIDQNSLKSRVSTAESTITQHASEIALRVEKNGVVAAINLSPEGTRILSSKIHIDGNVTFANGYDPTTIEVGGTNILFASDLPFTWAVSNATRVNNTDSNGINSIRANYSGSATNFNIQSPSTARKTPLKLGKKYTLSFEIRGNINTMTYNYLMRTEGANRAFPSPPNFSISTTTWTKISVTQECLWDSETGYVLIGTQDTASGKWFEIRKVQLEESDRASTWAPNPLELKADIDGWKFGNTTEIDGGKIRTDTITALQLKANEIEAIHIKSLNGLNVGNGQFQVDGSGNVTLRGKLEGVTGTFSGELTSTGFMKIRHPTFFYGQAMGVAVDVGRSGDGGSTWIKGGELQLYAWNDIVTLGWNDAQTTSTRIPRLDINAVETYLSGNLNLTGQTRLNGFMNTYDYLWVRRENATWSAFYVTQQSTGTIAEFRRGPGDGTQVARVNNDGSLSVPRIRGHANSEIVFFGTGNAQVDGTGGDLRIMRDNNSYLRINTGSIQMYLGGSIVHQFNSNGTKSGGTIRVDGINLGMSPVDSPQYLLEYIQFNIPLSEQGTKVYIDSTYLKTVEHYAVFPNNGVITEKGKDYFVIKGTGIADCRIVGERIGYAGKFYECMDQAA